MARNLKVLYIEAGHGLGGSARSLADSFRHVCETGVEAHVVMTSPRADASLFTDVGVNAEFVPVNPYAGTGPLPRAGILWHLTSKVLPAALSIRKKIKKHRVDLVHGNNDIISNLPGLLGARLARVPYVQHLRTTRKPTKIERFFSGRVARFIAITEQGEKLARIRFPAAAGKTTLVRDTILARDPAPLAPDEMRALSGARTLNAGVFANLVRGKGHDVLIEAVKAARSRKADVTLHVFGGEVPGHEAYAARIKSECAKHGFVRFMGYKEDAQAFMKNMDVVVEASTLPEGLQRTLIDAMLLGRTVIATDAGGAPEIILHERTGLLVPPGSADALADSLWILARNARKRKRLAESGREITAGLFDAKANADTLAQCYDGVVGGRIPDN